MPSVYEKIQNGDYLCEYIYSPDRATREERTATRLENSRREGAMTVKFRADIEAEEGTDRLPEAVRDKVWDLAWADGHAYGYPEVYAVYSKYGELATLAYLAGVKDSQ